MFALTEGLRGIALKYKPLNVFHCQLICNTFVRQLNQERRPTREGRDVFTSTFTRELENQLTRLRTTGGHTAEVLRKLLMTYCRRSHFWSDDSHVINDKIAVRLQEIVHEMTANQYAITDGIYSSLLEFYTNSQDLKSALEMRDKISKSFSIDSFKVINLATLLAKNNMIDESLAVIREHKNRSMGWQSTRSPRLDIRINTNGNTFDDLTHKSINRLLNTLIDKRLDTKVIKNVFQMCIEMSDSRVSKTVAGPLIRMHLVNKDVDKALQEFVFIANNYRIASWSLELMRTFIQMNDKKSLETIVQKSVDIYGKDNTLLDLSAAYVYNGFISEAKRHINNTQKLSQKSVEFLCDKFVRDHKMDELKRFIDLFASVEGIDTQKLYKLVVNENQRSGQTENTFEATNTMKDPNIEPPVSQSIH